MLNSLTKFWAVSSSPYERVEPLITDDPLLGSFAQNTEVFRSFVLKERGEHLQ
jgi:hypothetical protein